MSACRILAEPLQTQFRTTQPWSIRRQANHEFMLHNLSWAIEVGSHIFRNACLFHSHWRLLGSLDPLLPGSCLTKEAGLVGGGGSPRRNESGAWPKHNKTYGEHGNVKKERQERVDARIHTKKQP